MHQFASLRFSAVFGQFARHATLLLCSYCLISSAIAQSWPSKPIRLIVPYGPGGSTDLNGRAFGQKLQEAFGQSVVVENKPGGSAMIGAADVAKAAPDGYTFLVGSPQIFILNPLFFKERKYDAEKDFSPVGITLISPNYIMVHPQAPILTISELIQWAKANPGKAFYASSGAGSSGHLAGLLLNRLGNIELQHIGYKGSAGAVSDVLGGQVPILIDQPAPGITHVRAGKLRAVAVGTTERVAALAEVPTVREQGLPEFESSTWFGFFAPAGTPRGIIDRVYAELEKSARLPEIRNKFDPAGYITTAIGPDATAEKIRLDRARWTRLVQDAGVKPE